MDQHTTVVGLDVHRDSVTVAVLPPEAAQPRETLTIENHPKALQRWGTRWVALASGICLRTGLAQVAGI